MLDTIVLLTPLADEQRALARLLLAHNPDLAVTYAATMDDLSRIGANLGRNARLVAFASGVIVPEAILRAFDHGAYNFHPGPPSYPGWAPAHFALYDGAQTFGSTAHAMAAKVDAGQIIGVELFDIPEGATIRELEQLAFVRLAYLFWRLSRELARNPDPLPATPLQWSGVKSTQQMYREHCEIALDMDPEEVRRRLHAFNDDFRGIPFTLELHGMRFHLRPDQAPSVLH